MASYMLGRMNALDYAKTIGVDNALTYLHVREDNARPDYVRGYVDALLEYIQRS